MGPEDNSQCGPTAASTPTLSLPPAGRWVSRYSITIRQHKSLRNLIEAIPEADWTPIPYWMDGAADVAEITSTPFRTEPGAAPARLIVRRVKPAPGSQLALLARYSYHGFITDRDGETLELEADHRRHAEVENAIGAPKNACRPPPTPHLPEFELGPSRVLLPHPPLQVSSRRPSVDSG